MFASVLQPLANSCLPTAAATRSLVVVSVGRGLHWCSLYRCARCSIGEASYAAVRFTLHTALETLHLSAHRLCVYRRLGVTLARIE